MLITGLRGVGKTVLLGAFEERARNREWTTAEAEITKNVDLGPRMARLVRHALLQVAPKAKWKDRGRRAAAVLKSFRITVSPQGELTFGMDVDAAEGLADSGSLGEDLTDVLVALGERAQEQGRGVVLLFDEVQFLRPPSSRRSSPPSTRPSNGSFRSPSSELGSPSCRAWRARRSRAPSGSFSFR